MLADERLAPLHGLHLLEGSAGTATGAPLQSTGADDAAAPAASADAPAAAAAEPTPITGPSVDARALTRRAKLLISCLPPLPGAGGAETGAGAEAGDGASGGAAGAGVGAADGAREWMQSLYPPGLERERVIDASTTLASAAERADRGAGGGGGERLSGGLVSADRVAALAARSAAAAERAREREARLDERTRGVVEKWLADLATKVERAAEREARAAEREAAERAKEAVAAERRRAAATRDRARETEREGLKAPKVVERSEHEEARLREGRINFMHRARARRRAVQLRARLGAAA